MMPELETTENETESTDHRWFEDVIALLIGSSLVSFGLLFLKEAGLLIGGTAGISLLAHYKFGINFEIIFFLINLPFYYFSIRKMGWGFSIKTFIAVLLVSLLSTLHSKFIHIQEIVPIYASVFGGFIFGIGLIILFRHKASLGGFNILALYLQDKYSIQAGWLQMGADVVVILLSLSIVTTKQLILSILCGLIFNAIIALNHRKDRYTV